MKLPVIALALCASAFASHTAAPKKTITLDGARRVIGVIAAEARKHNAGGAIAVVDDGGNVVALERLDGTFAAASTVAIGKARTAALFRKPTRFFEEVVNKGRTSMVALDAFTPLQGGVPLTVDGEIVGAVGVSGASSAQQDEDFANAGAAALAQPHAPKDVTYIESAAVSSAFAKGVPLLEIGGYKIHASRREAPGQAEVHERDTDIMRVIAGSATLITGGKAAAAKATAPEEIRGDHIEGGHRRRIAPGDVIVIPNGVPHQFVEVQAPLTYYVVKVRSSEVR